MIPSDAVWPMREDAKRNGTIRIKGSIRHVVAARSVYPRRSFAALVSGFKGAKRRRRPLKSPARRLFQARVGKIKAKERIRILIQETTGSNSPAGQDALVPRCEENGDAEAKRGSTLPLTLAVSSTNAPVIQGSHSHRLPRQPLQPAPPSDRCQSQRLINIPIPDDPRLWSRLDVRNWLEHVRHVYDIRDLDLDRFPMNGKALCIMTKDMFTFRVPHGGIPLFLDFQMRFRRALGVR